MESGFSNIHRGQDHSSSFDGCMYDNFSGSSNPNHRNITSTTTTALATTSTSQGASPPHNIMAKWIVNLSSSPIMEVHELLWARGPNFSMMPRYTPKGEYIVAVEEVCLQHSPKVASKFTTESSCLPRKHCPPYVISAGKRLGLFKKLGEDRSRVIPTVDKGWLWWCRINKTASTRPRTYLQIKTPTDSP